MSKYYIFKDETIIGLADEARRLGKREGGLTSAEMKEIFAGINPDSKNSKIEYSATATGFLPIVKNTNSSTTLNIISILRFSSSVVGTL